MTQEGLQSHQVLRCAGALIGVLIGDTELPLCLRLPEEPVVLGPGSATALLALPHSVPEALREASPAAAAGVLEAVAAASADERGPFAAGVVVAII